jgi:hypothetical protein
MINAKLILQMRYLSLTQVDIGSSTQSEIEYAKKTGKVVKYLEPVNRKTDGSEYLGSEQN